MINKYYNNFIKIYRYFYNWIAILFITDFYIIEHY